MITVSNGGSTPAVTQIKNTLEFPAANFTARAVNDGDTDKPDGVFYRFAPTAEVTLPALSSMSPSTGMFRVRLTTDWAARAAANPVPNWVTDGTDTIEGQWPNVAGETVDLLADVTNGKWIITSGGETTLDLVIPTLNNLADTQTNLAPLLIADGTGDLPAGVYRRELDGVTLNMVG